MRTQITYCKNCGQVYNFQGSGHGADLYNDHEYCPKCKEAITLALNKIPIKTVVKWIATHLVTLEQLEQFEIDNNSEYLKNNKGGFPRVMRVFPETFNVELNEGTITREVYGRNEHHDKVFVYHYYPSKKEDVVIRVKARVNVKDNIIIRYER